jgi:hypothetical protein
MKSKVRKIGIVSTSDNDKGLPPLTSERPKVKSIRKLYRWQDLPKPMQFLIIQAHVAMMNKSTELLTKVFKWVKPKVYITVEGDILKSTSAHPDDVKAMQIFSQKPLQ